MEPNNTDLLLFSSPQFERCGRRKRTENLRWNTILILGMLDEFPPKETKSLYPHQLCLLAGTSPGHSWEASRGWLWLLLLLYPLFFLVLFSQFLKGGSSNFNNHLKLCSCCGLLKNRFLGFGQSTESAYLCMETRTLHFWPHATNTTPWSSAHWALKPTELITSPDSQRFMFFYWWICSFELSVTDAI